MRSQTGGLNRADVMEIIAALVAAVVGRLHANHPESDMTRGDGRDDCNDDDGAFRALHRRQ